MWLGPKVKITLYLDIESSLICCLFNPYKKKGSVKTSSYGFMPDYFLQSVLVFWQTHSDDKTSGYHCVLPRNGGSL